ncbi:MAG: hypothetical protein JKY95_13700 [Planctomycetaceae bacterium]|nr:hypothetical protein [Planctomycetaceae bacterium]
MNESSPPSHSENQPPAFAFHRRPASTAWEPIPLVCDQATAPSQSSGPSSIVWAWFKPQGMANQLTISIPPETFQATIASQPITLLQLLNAVQIDVDQLVMLSVFGNPIETSCKDHPVLHQPINSPGAVADPSIHFVLANATGAPTATPAVASPETANVSGGLIDDSLGTLFRSIEMDWTAIQHIESKLKALRKQLDGLFGRLNVLNRDLNPEENQHASQLEIRSWQDARRWLRDMSSRVSRYLKEHDIGMTSNAGNRQRLAQIHQQFITNKTPFEGIKQVQHEFEAYRKLIQNLMQSMSATQASAQVDGVQRAQQVLSQIAAKSRAARTRK